MATFIGNRSMIHKMGLLFLMYVSQKIFLCFNWALLPILLRQRGFSLESIGFTAFIYSPWALKFLYASAVDRFYSIAVGKRKSWLVPLLVVFLFMLPLLALLSPQKDLILLMMAVFLLNMIFATIDIAVDGYATDILQPDERPWGNTVQIAGYVIGYLMGAGVFLIVYQLHGWRMTLVIMAVSQFLIMVPILRHREIAAVLPDEDEPSAFKGTGGSANGWSFINQPQNRLFLLLAGLLVVFDQGGVQLRMPMVSDSGIKPAVLGQVNLWIGSPMCLLGAVMGGVLLRRLGYRRILFLGCTFGAATHFFSAMVARGWWSGGIGIGIMMGAEKLMAGIISLLVYSLIMTLSVGYRSAANYAVLGSLVSLFGLGIHPLMGKICDTVGYFNLYLGLGLFSIVAFFVGDILLERILEGHR